jgi:hypothetical protein
MAGRVSFTYFSDTAMKNPDRHHVPLNILGGEEKISSFVDPGISFQV